MAAIGQDEDASTGVAVVLPDNDEIRIGSQTWAAKNLNVDHFRNGDAIPEVRTHEEWKAAGNAGIPAWSYYDNDPDKDRPFGKLYNWFAVHDPRGLAPAGWHIPSNEEWVKLIDNLGGGRASNNKLKHTSGWTDDGNGTNESGFAGLPGGGRLDQTQHFANRKTPYFAFRGVYSFAAWWSISYNFAGKAQSLSLVSETSYRSPRTENAMEDGLSVRVLKGDPARAGSEAELEGVQIGYQTWAARNLDVTHFRNGDPIPQAQSDDEWARAGRQGTSAWSYYTDYPEKDYEGPLNGEKFGKLYNWFAVNDPRGLAPKGWHVPTDEEWVAFFDYLDYGRRIHNERNETVRRPTGVDAIDSEFAAMAGGYRGSLGTFDTLGHYASWWSSSYAHGDYAWDRKLLFGYGQYVSRGAVFRKDVDRANGSSVRLVKR
jgi:uncharacterized protein (TIGR02145 family)